MFKYHELDDCRKKDLQLVEKKIFGWHYPRKHRLKFCGRQWQQFILKKPTCRIS